MNTRKRNRVLRGIAGVATAVGITYACADFLEIPPQGAVGEPTVLTQEGVEGSLVAAYRLLDCSNSSGAWGCAASNWVWGSVTSDDAYKGSDAGDQQPINSIENYSWSVGEAEGYLDQKWGHVYDGVFRANATIRLLDKVRTLNPNDIADDTAAYIRGEALFLRAHYHFEAYRMWGHIPYYFENDTTPVVVGGYRKANDLPLDSILKLVIADLDTAAALLPSAPRDGEKGRASAWTARAYKGRVQVYAAAEDPAFWDSALVTLRDVEQNGPYDLEASFDRVWTGFAQYENGPETILAFQASVRDGEPSGWNSNYGERLNFPHSGSHFGCCGFHQPSQNLVNFYAVDSITGLPLALADANWNAPNSNFVGGASTRVDPRLDWTVGRHAVPFKDWGLHEAGWIRDPAYSGEYSAKRNIHEKAANAENNVGWVATQTNAVNIHLFRYADLLLLLAEAEVEVGSLANALAIVNQVRARAGQRAQGCGDPAAVAATWAACGTDSTLMPMAVPMQQGATLDSLDTPWARYRIGLYPAFPSQAYARQAVWYERRLELAMEGQRFFDLRRWGAADTTIARYLAVEGNRRGYLAGATFEPRHALYPIPTIQIQLSRVGGQDRLVQNTGW